MTDPNTITDAFDLIPSYDPRSGSHYWVIIAVYRNVAPKDESVVLSTENLVSITPCGCAYCGIPWSELNSRRRCPGSRRRTITALSDRN